MILRSLEQTRPTRGRRWLRKFFRQAARLSPLLALASHPPLPILVGDEGAVLALIELVAADGTERHGAERVRPHVFRSFDDGAEVIEPVP